MRGWCKQVCASILLIQFWYSSLQQCKNSPLSVFTIPFSPSSLCQRIRWSSWLTFGTCHDRIPSHEASLAPGLPRSLRASVRTADTVLTHMVLTWLVDNFGISRTTTFVFTRRSVKGNDDCYTQSLRSGLPWAFGPWIAATKMLWLRLHNLKMI